MMMMTNKKFNATMAEAARVNKKNTVIAASAAGATGLLAAGITFVIGHNNNKKQTREINNLKTDINNLNTSVTITENIIAATTKAVAANDDIEDNIKYIPINIYEYTSAVNNKKSIYTKSKSGDTINFTNVPTSLENYSFTIKYYMTEEDYNEIFKGKTEETPEEKPDNKK